MPAQTQTHLRQRLDHPRFTQKPGMCLLKRKFAVKESSILPFKRYLSQIRGGLYSSLRVDRILGNARATWLDTRLAPHG